MSLYKNYDINAHGRHDECYRTLRGRSSQQQYVTNDLKLKFAQKRVEADSFDFVDGLFCCSKYEAANLQTALVAFREIVRDEMCDHWRRVARVERAHELLRDAVFIGYSRVLAHVFGP
jgi:hypothetical protein